MNILGISDVTGNHSHSCVALLQDGELTFALSQERLSGVKNDSRFPYGAIDALLDYSGLTLDRIDYFACGYPPSRYYSGLLQRSRLDLPRSLFYAGLNAPFTLARYLAPNIKKGLFDPAMANGLYQLGVSKDKFQFVDHHLAHVNAAYRSSPFDNAIGISYGGFAPHADGQNMAGAVYRCCGKKITFLENIPMPATGCYYSGAGIAMGFRYMEQEGKIMGLAAQENPQICLDQVKKITTTFNGERWIPYAYWIDYIFSPRQKVFLNSRSGRRFTKLLKLYSRAAVAAAVQQLWQNNITGLVQHLAKKYVCRKFILAGGVFSNVQINAQLAALDVVENLFVHPFPADGSTTLGAMYTVYTDKTGRDLHVPLSDMGLGMEFSDAEIAGILKNYNSSIHYSKVKNVPSGVARALADGKIVGWFQGREEYGPRSLGHRCLLGDPRFPESRAKLTRLKQRDFFIPTAPSCLAEKATEYFENFSKSPFMTRAYPVFTKKKAGIPAAIHADGTARAQAVDRSFYPPFRKLIEYFYTITGVPMVLNTSLNQHGHPIIHEPEQAVDMLLSGEMDQLAIGSFIVHKQQRTP
ncbi:hypothetical protein JW935_12955 [candidate division KSB1 bacterium]|nr:hypothetical protein [candidate division KSB1 bacterium]